MDGANIDPNATGPTAADPQQNAGNPVGAPSGVPEGVQRRFDEMTAEKHDLKRQLEAQQMQIQQLLDVVGRASSQAAHPQIPQVEIDPEQKKLMDAYMGPAFAQLQQRVETALGSIRPTVVQTRLQQLLQQEPDSRVQGYAQKLLQTWQADPVRFGSAWNEQDAINYARGVIADEDRRNGRQPQNARQAMNNNATPVTSMPSVQSPLPPSGEPPPLPADFDDLSYGKQAEILAERIKKYGGGVVL